MIKSLLIGPYLALIWIRLVCELFYLMPNIEATFRIKEPLYLLYTSLPLWKVWPITMIKLATIRSSIKLEMTQQYLN